MTDEELTLRQIAQRAVDRNNGQGGRALDRAAKKAGLTLSYTTVDKILAGTYRSQPTTATLDALAQLAGVSRQTVYAAASRPLPQAPLAEQLPPGADSLTPPQREVVISIVRQFAAANDAVLQLTTGSGKTAALIAADFDRSEDVGPAGPYDADLDALPSEADDPQPIPGRSLQEAARLDDEKSE